MKNESIWKDKTWYKELCIAMFVARVPEEVQSKAKCILEDLDEGDAEIKCKDWCSLLNNIKVAEQFEYSLNKQASIQTSFLGLFLHRKYNFDVVLKASELFKELNNEGKNKLYNMLKQARSENEFLKEIAEFKIEQYPIIDEPESIDETNENIDSRILKIIDVCEKLRGSLAHLNVVLNDGTSMTGMFIHTIKPCEQNNYKGALFFRTYEYEIIRIIPEDINTVQDMDEYDPRFETYYTVGEFYDAVIATKCMYKKIVGIRTVGDFENLANCDFFEDREYRAHIFTYGPLVIEFEDGTNIALSIFRNGAYGLKENFTGEYKGVDGPNIDADIVFSKLIGRKIERLEVISNLEDENGNDKSYPAMDIYDAQLWRANFYLEDGIVLELLDYPSFTLDDGSEYGVLLSSEEWIKACGIPEELL